MRCFRLAAGVVCDCTTTIVGWHYCKDWRLSEVVGFIMVVGRLLLCFNTTKPLLWSNLKRKCGNDGFVKFALAMGK